MAAPRTPDDLRAAVESMFRIRAVESPPDPASGLRKVWHRGALHAELVSELDREGRVVRHELSLFDDVLVWEQGRGFLTGVTRVEGSTRGAAKVAFDGAADGGRVARAVQALRPYAGIDRILLHLRTLLLASERGVVPLEGFGAVTGEHRAVPSPELEAPPKPTRSPWVVRLLVINLLLLALILAVLRSR